jgi:anti-sigma factor RsiW
MNHPTSSISAFLDGELSAVELISLEAHLASCGRCVAEMQDVQRVRAAVRALPLIELPDDLALDGEPGNVTPIHRHRLVWAGAAAVVAVVVAAAALSTPPPSGLTVDDLTSRFGARVSLDPAFGPAKVVVPDWESEWAVTD